MCRFFCLPLNFKIMPSRKIAEQNTKIYLVTRPVKYFGFHLANKLIH